MLPECQIVQFQPPIELMADVQLPDRSNMKTVGDMIRIIIADEEVIRFKNADLKALREYTAKLQEVGNAK